MPRRSKSIEGASVEDKRGTENGVQVLFKWDNYPAPSWEYASNRTSKSSTPSTSRKSRGFAAVLDDPANDLLATANQTTSSSRSTRTSGVASVDASIDGSSPCIDQTPSSSRGATTSIIAKMAQTASLQDELVKLSKTHLTIRTLQGEAAVVQATTLKEDDLQGIKIWTPSAYSEWAKAGGLSVHADEHFLGQKFKAIIGYFPYGTYPYYVITTEARAGKKPTDVNEVVHVIDCLLAGYLFPKAITQYASEFAYST